MPCPYDPRRPLHEALEIRGPGGEATVRELVRAIGLHRRSRVLELGCGSGRTACQIAREVGCEVVATDLDPDCLEATLARVLRERLSARFAAEGKGLVRVRQADARSLFAFFPHTRFDAVIAEHVVGLLGIEVVGPSVLSVLDEDGYFAYSVVGWRNPPAEIPAAIREHWQRLFPVPLYTLQENLQRLSAAGFGRGFAWELGPEAWEAYYGPLRRRVEELLARGIRSEEIDLARRELELWYEHEAHHHIAAWMLVGQPGEGEEEASLLAAELAEPHAGERAEGL